MINEIFMSKQIAFKAVIVNKHQLRRNHPDIYTRALASTKSKESMKIDLLGLFKVQDGYDMRLIKFNDRLKDEFIFTSTAKEFKGHNEKSLSQLLMNGETFTAADVIQDKDIIFKNNVYEIYPGCRKFKIIRGEK